MLIDRLKDGLKRQVVSSAKTGPAFRCGVLGLMRAGGQMAAGDRARVILPDGDQKRLPSL
ncbi:hypothetical protein [Bradyrhizobium rifense]|uniref:hypothetical protein n=1 Tax=Bradyrhizobium rifense TaxID=515499 RepID=UPI001FEB0C67|nr:hypothetical protein [Bradyrhizobium rifense]